MLKVLGHWFAAVCGQGPGHTWAPGGILLPCCQRCTGLYVGAGIAALLHLGLRPRLSGRLLQIHGAFLLAMVPLGFHWVAQGPVLRSLSGVLFGFGVVTFLWLPLNQLTEVFGSVHDNCKVAKAAQDTAKSLHLWHFLRFLAASISTGMADKPEGRDCQRSLPALPVSEGSPQPVRPSNFGRPSAFGPRISVFHCSQWQCQALYFLVLMAMLPLLPATATLGGDFAAYSLSALASWGALVLAGLIAGNVGLGVLGALRRLHRLAHPRLQP